MKAYELIGREVEMYFGVGDGIRPGREYEFDGEIGTIVSVDGDGIHVEHCESVWNGVEDAEYCAVFTVDHADFGDLIVLVEESEVE